MSLNGSPDDRIRRLLRPVVKAKGISVILASLAFHGAVSAQESGHKWRFFDTTYNTQQEAEAAIRAIGGGYGYISVVRDRRIFEDRIELVYGIPHELGALRGWHEYINGNAGVTATEQASLDAIRMYYNNKSTAAGCTPNTTITVDGAWRGVRFWDDGVAHQELAYYDVRYVQKPIGSTTCGNSSTTESILRNRRRCSNEYLTWNTGNVCKEDVFNHFLSAPLVACDPCNLVGNPTDVSTGDKFETESDFDLGWISLQRYYHSATSNNGNGGFGHGWTHSHDFKLAINANDFPTVIGLVQPNGSHLAFRNLGSNVFEAADDSGDRIIANGANWELSRSDEVMVFNAGGRVVERRFENGTSLAYVYDAAGRLTTISHSNGRSLVVNYGGLSTASPITSITSAGSALATYGYNPNGQVQTVQFASPESRTYHYEDANFPLHLTGISAEGGVRFSTFSYDAQGRLIVSQHAGGADKVSLAYTAQGGAVVTDALGYQTNYGLNDAGSTLPKPRKPGDVVDSKGTVARTYYPESVDFRRRLDTVTDRNGTQTKHAYAEASDPVTGQPARTHTVKEAVGLPQERSSTERRDIASNRTLLTQADNRETRIVRNARLQPVTVTVRDTVSNQTRTTAYAYCEAADVAASNSTCPILGLVKSVDGPRTDVNDITTFQYYGSDDSTCATQPALCTYRKGDLRKVVDALGRSTETFGYDPQGRPLSVADANGIVTDYEYHPRGWIAATKVRGADNSVETDDRITRVEYWPTGLVKRITPPGGAYITYTYDTAQRLTSVADKAGNKIQYTLDLAGNRKREDINTASGTLKRTLSRVFNTLGQLQTVKDSLAHATSFSYDNDGNPDLTTDALSRVTNQDHDPLNRLSRTLQDVGGLAVETKLEYNALDQVTKVTDPKGLSTTYGYDGFGDRVEVASPDTGVTIYGYNGAGLLASKQDANDANRHTYTYDALNRPKTVSYSSGAADVEYDYDTVNSVCVAGENFALGRVTAMRSDGTELKYCYDRWGQLVRKVQTVGTRSFTLRYAYTSSGQVRSITYPDNAVVDYVRNTLDQVTEVGIKPAGGVRTVLLNNAAYEPFGPATGWTYGNGRSLSRTYDQDYRAKTILDSAAGGLSLAYGYNEVGELTELKDGLQSAFLAKYDYDTLGRLKITRDGPTGTALETYGYDATGNRSSLLRGGITISYTYPGTSHRLSNVGGVSRGYNAVGNTTSIGGTAREFVYNANDRMSQVKQAGVVKASYRYNAKGERVSRADNATGAITGYTLYDEAGHWLGDYDANGATKQQAIWLGDAPVGLVVGAGVAQTLRYVQPDHLGTPRAVIDPSRNLAVWTWDAKGEAFGNSPPNQDPDQDGTAFVFDMRFPGQRFDTATGLIYNHFRDYDPVSGRYVQSDPIGLSGGISTYGYVGAAPLNGTDRHGLQTLLAGGRGMAWSNGPIGSLEGIAGNRLKEHVYPNAKDISSQIFARTIELPAADEDNNGIYWCAELIKVWFKAPHTTAWRAGRRLKPGLPLQPGTAIATFNEKGLFPQDGIAHAAIFVHYTRSGDGIVVIDQWPQYSVVRTRTLAWDYNDGDFHRSYVNSAKNFFTITW
ncbi:BPSL0067 family protein [Lysobacter antibioticus]|uniref:RHS repeat-associated core domain protein n=1 Tax=Lysobacter antibioticus TaxID=84531 RepID=A0A0S2FHN6_LYSAN|nr:BPSL0067 family protein [Lysobacter antibioticus]ALN83082.1 RHS repeat-associated core domain protein [Lysobacter antibioticus]